jgi:hypothetical protein
MQNRLLFMGKKRDITGPKPAYRKRSYKKRKKKKKFHTPIVVHANSNLKCNSLEIRGSG